MTPDLRFRCQQLSLSAEQTESLTQYLQLLEKWNKVYNLTALRDGEKMLTHHIFDSLSVLPALKRVLGDGKKRILDVGSGAGLPGVVLAIALPDVSVTCIDTVGKKAAFVQQVAVALRLPNLAAVHGRVEQWRGAPFDVVTSRAFSSLADFVELSRGHLAGQGVWMAMKGKVPDEELGKLPESVEVFHVEQLDVPEVQAQRCLVWLRCR